MTKTDDIDGSPANETVTFAVDRVAHEIDLSADHAAELPAAFEPFVSAGRRTGHSGGPVRRVNTSGYDSQAVRAFARSRGVEIPARGRVPRAVVELFGAAGN